MQRQGGINAEEPSRSDGDEEEDDGAYTYGPVRISGTATAVLGNVYNSYKSAQSDDAEKDPRRTASVEPGERPLTNFSPAQSLLL